MPTGPEGPEGQKRPADPVASALMVARIAVGDRDDERVDPDAREGGLKGGRARAEKLTPERRSEIARKAASARWGKG